MSNLEYLGKVKKQDEETEQETMKTVEEYNMTKNYKYKYDYDTRKVKALEIIAEELIGINYHLKNFAEAIQSFTNENQTAIRVENIGR